MATSAESARPLRADAQRNRDALIAAARELFRTRGADVSMLEIAEAAGVGNGTLYRHFPERELLLMAVYQEGLAEVCSQASRLLSAHPADQAVELWLQRVVEYVGSNLPLKQLVMQLPELAGRSNNDPVPAMFTETETLLVSTMTQLLDAAAEQKLIGNAQPRDLLRLTSAICQIDASSKEAMRMITLLVDGLRFRRS